MGPGELPKSRPVCGASCSLNQELSEWVSQILEAGIESKEHSEVISTEDLLNQIDRLNKSWRESGVQMDQD